MTLPIASKERPRTPSTKKAGSRRAPKRAQQQRSVTTRSLILKAAIAEFAEKGFDAASIRSIAERISLQHPLITYHFPSKDALWRASAEYTFAQIREEWDRVAPEAIDISALKRVREEYRSLFRYTVAFPEFHRFMRQETYSNNPRLKWVAQNVLKPLLDRLLPQIRAAQREGLLPRVEPIVFHYMMVSLTTTLSEFGPEMLVTSGLSSYDAKIADTYWTLVEEIVFRDFVVAPAGLSRKMTAVPKARGR
jgi:TetR/AcrR family transcriptional regulator